MARFEDAVQRTDTLKRYVERLMLVDLQSGWEYSSAKEFGQLLSKPRDPHTLKLKITELELELALYRAALVARTPPVDADPKSTEMGISN